MQKLSDLVWKYIQLEFCASKLEAVRVIQLTKKDLEKAFRLAEKDNVSKN